MNLNYNQIVKIVKETAVEDLPRLLKYAFSFKENIIEYSLFTFPHTISSKTPAFHQEIYDFLFDKNNGAMAAPRGFAKSTVVGLFYLTWLIVNKKKKFIVYMSQNHEKTVQFIDPIRHEFKHNERIKLIYGDMTPKGMEDEDGHDRQDLIEINGVRIQAVSFNKDIRGFKDKYGNRPDLIIGDDIDSMERLINPVLRKKDFDKLTKEVIPSLANFRGSNLKMIGTILHWDSLLVNRIKKYGGKIYEACKFNEKGSIIPSSLLWADYWTSDRLMALRKDIGSVAFSSEMLNNPIDNTSAVIKKEWIMSCCDETMSYDDEIKGFDSSYLGVDFAFGDRAVNDKSAFVTIKTQNGQPHRITKITTKKGLSITNHFDYITELNNIENYTCVVMEENSIKGMSKELYHYTFRYYLIWTGSSDTAGKLTPSQEFEKKRHTISKRNMIVRMGTQFENKNIKLPYKTDKDQRITNELISELSTFALQDGKLVEVGIHADIPMALGMALEKIAQANKVIIDF